MMFVYIYTTEADEYEVDHRIVAFGLVLAVMSKRDLWVYSTGFPFVSFIHAHLHIEEMLNND